VHKQISKKINITFPVIVSCQEYLQTNVDCKSGVHLSAILRFYFTLPVVVCSHILQAAVANTAMLHSISCDMIEAVRECQALIRHFETEKNDISILQHFK